MDQKPDIEWTTLMNLIDTNEDGKIAISEFEEFSNKQQATQGDKGAQIEMGLKALDLNHDGNLDKVDNNKILYILTSILVIILFPYPLITKNLSG